MIRLMFAALTGLFLSLSTLAAAQTTYPLTCRGGNGTLGINTETKVASFFFTKTSGPAAAGLQAGQCAWQDRAVGANEPTCVVQNNVNISAWIFPSNLSASYFSAGNSAHEWIRRFLKAENYETFQAYNPGNSACFIITRVGF